MSGMEAEMKVEQADSTADETAKTTPGTQPAADRSEPTGQLRLLAGNKRRPRRPEWVLDQRTREIGKAGVAAIRETLRRAHPPAPIKKAS
jgi:hypothetical protein